VVFCCAGALAFGVDCGFAGVAGFGFGAGFGAGFAGGVDAGACGV